MSGAGHGHPWWQTAVIEQLYPRSFADSNGDGVGDLDGIRRHLDHLVVARRGRHLAVAVLPLADGRLRLRRRRLLRRRPAVRHARRLRRARWPRPTPAGLKVADRLGARTTRRTAIRGSSSRARPATTPSGTGTSGATRRPTAGPPNNWIAAFTDGASAWTLDDATGQYYLHLFLPQQPDLNWRNPEVVEAMHDTLRFWLDRGVDGFRMDVIHGIVKRADLADVDDGFAADGRREPLRPAGDPRTAARHPHAARQLSRRPRRASARSTSCRPRKVADVLRRRRRAAPRVQLPAAVRAVGRERSGARASNACSRSSTRAARGRHGCCRTTTTHAIARATAPKHEPAPPRCCC